MIDLIAQALAEGLCKKGPAALGFASERVDEALPRGCAVARVHGLPAPGCAVSARRPNLRQPECERPPADRCDEAVLQTIDRRADAAQAIKRAARHDLNADERRLWLPAHVRSHEFDFRRCQSRK